MPSPEFVASAVLPLLVALFNLLVAGYAVAAPTPSKRQFAFAAGPAGVGLWAMVWFISLFNAEALDTLRVVGAVFGLLAISGFAADGLLELPSSIARWIAAVGAAVIVGIVIVVIVFVAPLFAIDVVGIVMRALAIGLIGLAITAHAFVAWGGTRAGQAPDGEQPRLARHAVYVAIACTSAYVGFALFAYVRGRTGVDPMLLVVLVAECLALVYIAHRRVELRILLPRAVTYAIFAMGTAVVTAVGLKLLGYAVDVQLVALTVVIALVAAIGFMSVGELMSSGFERLLFPERARLTRALGASRGEVAALKRRLERAERLAIVGELAASVAHEIKNPLAPIRGYAQLLGGKLTSVEDEQRNLFERGLKIIQDESDRIDGRIQELLGMARPDRALANPDATLELNRVVLEAVAVAEAEPGVQEIVQDLEPDLPRVCGDEDEIRGALLNLLKNAAEAMQGTDGSRISVQTRRDGDTVRVTVDDEGVGIAEDDAARVFEAFYTTKEGGTGLGMAITRSAVEAAGGRITIGPRPASGGSEGRGARVQVELQVEPGFREAEGQT